MTFWSPVTTYHAIQMHTPDKQCIGKHPDGHPTIKQSNIEVSRPTYDDDQNNSNEEPNEDPYLKIMATITVS